MPVELVPFSQMSAHYCEYCYLSNLSDPNVLRSTDDITNIDYRDQSNQVSDDDLVWVLQHDCSCVESSRMMLKELQLKPTF